LANADLNIPDVATVRAMSLSVSLWSLRLIAEFRHGMPLCDRE